MTAKSAATRYADQNLAAAKIILADPRYEGALAEWARMVMAKSQPTVVGPLFDERRAA